MNFKDEKVLNLDERTVSITEKSQEKLPIKSPLKEQKALFLSEDFISISRPEKVISGDNSMVPNNNSSPVGGAFNAAIELTLQPHVIPTTGNGSGSTPSKKDDDDDKKKRGYRRR